MSKETGGQAFPCLDDGGGGLSLRDGGMTLRDYFAAKAMQSHIVGMRGLPPSHEWKLEAAQLAYRMADAMLEARK